MLKIEQLRAMRLAFVAASAASLVACGGGGGGGSSTPVPPPPPPPPPPAPQMSTTLSPANGSAQFVEGGAGTMAFTVRVSNPGNAAIVPVVTPDSANLVVSGAVDTSVANQYTVQLATPAGLPPGKYTGNIAFKLCSDSNCSTTYAGGTQSFPYTVTVTLDDWKTFQRNASHTGFVNVQLDPTAFATAWTWQRPAGDPEPIGGINSVATGDGKIFVTKDIYFGQGAVYALDEATGTQQWTYALGPMSSEGPAAFSDGMLYVPSMDGSEHGSTWALDATTGLYKYKMSTSGQWTSFFAPTVQGDTVVQSGQDGEVYDFATANGGQRWAIAGETSDQSTPALDATRVFVYGDDYGSAAMRIFDRATGATLASITDPFASGTNYSMFSSTLLGATNDAIAFSGGGFSGQAASSSEQYDSRVLVSYDLVHAAVGWRSANAYLTHPALANGVVYAARNAPASFDAMSEADGHVLWSWTPPTGTIGGDTAFHRNIVVTRNLAFVSTDVNVYAIDLTTHQSVWKYPKPGMLAISGSGMLLIATGARVSDGGLVAIKLQ